MSESLSARPKTGRTSLRGNPALTLAAVCFGLFMVGLDGTVVSIANPAIALSLGTSFTELQWITNAYLLGLAVFLILGGKLGDRFGRKKMYLIGVVAFAVTSVAIGLIGTTEGVIIFRALQGLSAALLMPQTLALLRATFPREKFGVAIGIWGGASSVAIAAGPILGGLLVGTLGWESVFFINAPIAVVGVILGLMVLRESTAPGKARFDFVGIILLALGLFGVVLAVVQSEAWGWTSPLTLGVLALGLVLIVAFVLVENWVDTPLLPMSLFRNPTVSIGALAVAANFFALFGVTFFLSLFLLNLRGEDGLAAGVMLLPLSAVSIIASPIGAALVSKFGIRFPMALGLALVGLSLFALTFISLDSPYLGMAVPFVVLALGVGMVMTAGAEAIVGSAPVHLAGVAGGLQATALQLGGALGTAILAAVVSSSVSARLGTVTFDGSEAVAQGIVPEGLDAATTLLAQDAFLGGLHAALVVAGVVALVIAALAAVFVRSPRAHVDVETVLVEAESGLAGSAMPIPAPEPGALTRDSVR
ncbi:EmrB/QacA subfamily drug resistance transporter [Glaciihabitans tibetensis]|uniref:EmrB/QacA subfamily drug resistance transporter n=1 Tax=Glaciihabitans tibetensis TaxID=1266600 RepID=A0A2T0V5U1_9MICO|nr:MFS transporter [Glaciihabitans tibetensis]PRY65448.1 EmrB/QacA subfamily drug resistance transporter [Glaciihabitans tibetensis]